MFLFVLFFFRSRNGPNNNPNCLQFFHTYRRLLSHIDIKNNTGNCLIQDNTEMLGVTEIQNKQITDVFWERKREEEIQKIEENVQRFLPNSLTFLQENTVSYIAGFITRSLIKQISCTSCAKALTQQYDECDSSLVLIQRKTRGGLINPARSVRVICKKNRCKFNQYFHITVTDHTYHAYYSTFTKNHFFLLIN